MTLDEIYSSPPILLLITSSVSAVISAIISIVVTHLKNDRTISIENITKERKTWRDKIRELALKGVQALRAENKDEIELIRSELMINLNPCDTRIIDLMQQSDEPQRNAEHFLQEIQNLLKSDWELSKLEAKPFLLRIKGIGQLFEFLFIRNPKTTQCKKSEK